MPNVIVSGAIANKCHNGGEAWVRLNWILGLRKLGCNVHFIEQISPSHLTDDRGAASDLEHSQQLAYFQRVARAFALEGHSTLICGDLSWGKTRTQLQTVAEEADLLINISGHLTDEGLLQAMRRRAYIDIDPGYTQCWLSEPGSGFSIAPHDVYFTIGRNIGRSDCAIPTAGIEWIPIWPPVVLDRWPVRPVARFECFSTIASWRGGFGPVSHGGITYGQKVHEFRRFIDLPRRTGCRFEIALQIHPAETKDLKTLQDHGWNLLDPVQASGEPARFASFVSRSSAEFSVAQGVYVHTRSGWFSDRSACYLASGRPAIVQETGLSEELPIGRGLLTFATAEEAVQEVERLTSEYPVHCRAARQVAERFLESDRVLKGVLTASGVHP